jgi:hypothetical protein
MLMTLRRTVAVAAIVSAVAAGRSAAQEYGPLSTNGEIEMIEHAPIERMVCASRPCDGVRLANSASTGLEGCFWNGVTQCVGDCVYCGMGSYLSFCVSGQGSCDPYGSGTSYVCGSRFTNPCYYSEDVPWKIKCFCSNEGGTNTGNQCWVTTCANN